MIYKIHIKPEPASRPSPSVYKGKVKMVNKPKYAKYKNLLSLLCRGGSTIINGKKVVGVRIPKEDYYRIDMDFYFPYPKSTPQKHRIEGYPMRKLPDWDNCAKALQDSIVQAKIIKDDNQISGGRTDQWYTVEPEGRIEFMLHIFNEEEWLKNKQI